MWEVTDDGSVREATERFDDAMKRRMLAFKLDGQESEQIKAFDPSAAEIVLIPAIAGG